MGPFLSYANRSLNPAIDLGPHKDTTLDVYFFILILGGHIGLPLALGTMVFTKTAGRRHPTLVNLLVSWFVYATANLLLLYSGEQSKPQPEFSVCLAQASTIYGSTVGVAAATLSLVLQLWMEFKNVKLARDSQASTLTNAQLLLLPWAFFLFITIGALVYGAKNPSTVSIRWVFYCTLSSSAVIYTVCAFTLVFLAFTLVFEGSVLRTLYKASRQFKAVNQTSYHLMLRVTFFTAYSLTTFIISIIIVLKPTSIFAYIFVSTLPLAVFLVFGTQKETLRVWFRIGQKAERHIPLAPMTFKPSAAEVSETASGQPCSAGKRLPATPKSFSDTANDVSV
ncbi:hypothetical protein DFH11DRAFT_1514159 [Phellopilus nigrolimitatus]|nr:hypothetical protein DFH11DRAFT_1514159 [Phellopilus nigrolimitatus]